MLPDFLSTLVFWAFELAVLRFGTLPPARYWVDTQPVAPPAVRILDHPSWRSRIVTAFPDCKEPTTSYLVPGPPRIRREEAVTTAVPLEAEEVLTDVLADEADEVPVEAAPLVRFR
jgi:hypothetical protein